MDFNIIFQAVLGNKIDYANQLTDRTSSRTQRCQSDVIEMAFCQDTITTVGNSIVYDAIDIGIGYDKQCLPCSTNQ